jgi:hypothetical protein
MVAAGDEQHVAGSAEQGGRRDRERPARRHGAILPVRAAAA